MIVVLLSVPFAYSQAQAQTPSGYFCIDGLVIDHEENPIAGWKITAEQNLLGSKPVSVELETTSAGAPNKGQFRFDEANGLLQAQSDVKLTLSAPTGFGKYEAVTPDTFQVRLDVGTYECVRVRFKIRRLEYVTVVKVDQYLQPLEGWKIIAEPGPENAFASPQMGRTDVDGKVSFYLSPGEWIFREQRPDAEPYEPAYDFKPFVPADGVQELNVIAGKGPYLIRFKNKIIHDGCVDVYKIDGDAPEYGLADWQITVLRADWSVVAEGTTDPTGYIRFEGLPRGPYTIQEESRGGWTHVSPPIVDIVLTGHGCQEVLFENIQDEVGFAIEGRKIDVNGTYGLPGWQITAEPLAKGGIAPAPEFTDGQGEYRFDFPFNDYRVPGASYEVCEVLQNGWVPVGATCHTVTLPEHPGASVIVPDFKNAQVGHDLCRVRHIVTKGETLFHLAKNYSVSIEDIKEVNPTATNLHWGWLYRGQVICIP
jgi:hypothetical protein